MPPPNARQAPSKSEYKDKEKPTAIRISNIEAAKGVAMLFLIRFLLSATIRTFFFRIFYFYQYTGMSSALGLSSVECEKGKKRMKKK